MDIIAIPGFSEPVSSWSHLLAAGAGFVGFFYLYYRGRGNLMRVMALLGYSLALIFLFAMSGVYHLLDPEYLPRLILQRIDHAAIWILIAGTFTPIHIILFRGKWRWGMLSIVWIIAITGLVLEVIFFKNIPEWVSLSGYLGLGWIGVFTTWHFIKIYADLSMHLLWLGGLAYSIGALLEFLNWPLLIAGVVESHEIFHLFVILGAFLHWLFIYKWAQYPTRDQVVFLVKELPDSRFVAKVLGELINLEAQSMELLRSKIRDVVQLKFHKIRPLTIRLKFITEEAFDI